MPCPGRVYETGTPSASVQGTPYCDASSWTSGRYVASSSKTISTSSTCRPSSRMRRKTDRTSFSSLRACANSTPTPGEPGRTRPRRARTAWPAQASRKRLLERRELEAGRSQESARPARAGALPRSAAAPARRTSAASAAPSRARIVSYALRERRELARPFARSSKAANRRSAGVTRARRSSSSVRWSARWSPTLRRSAPKYESGPRTSSQALSTTARSCARDSRRLPFGRERGPGDPVREREHRRGPEVQVSAAGARERVEDLRADRERRHEEDLLVDGVRRAERRELLRGAGCVRRRAPRAGA